MSVLILKNTSSEGPGTIGEYLDAASIPARVVELGEGEAPPPLDAFDAIIILGGPMSVYEMKEYPHLTACSRLIREAINRGMKVLGICLGAQLIAHCLGAKVYGGHEVETGWFDICLTGDGLRDPVMRRLALHPEVGDFWRRFKVFHWHGDTFDLPMGAVRLAGSELYENQAFRHGDRVYALQFHIEVTDGMLREWLRDEPGGKHLIGQTEMLYEEYSGRAANFYRAFFSGLPDKKSQRGNIRQLEYNY